MPFLSIITATYNAVATLGGCLAGIHSQSIPLEHIIIDGGSTDGTLDIVAAYRDHVTKVVSEPDKGIYDAMNKGIRLAGGEIVGVLNADDFYFDAQVLAKVAQVFENTEVDSCYGDLLYVREKRRPKVKDKTQNSRVESDWKDKEEFEVVRYWKSGEFRPEKFYWGWMPPHPTFFVRRAIYEKFGFFNLDSARPQTMS